MNRTVGTGARRFARGLALLSFGAGVLAHTRIRSGALDPSLFVYVGKMFGSACAPVLGLAGALGAAFGLLDRDPLATVTGSLGALLSTTT
jgi:hypothetical protein